MDLDRTSRLRAIISAVVLAVMVWSAALTGCGSKPTATPTPTKTPTLPAVSTPTPANPVESTYTSTPTFTPRANMTPTSTATPTATSTPTPIPLVEMGPDICPLTGLKVDDPEKLNRRPLGVKIPNYPADARPQSGLSSADVVIEHEAEASLTRFTAIFLSHDVSPELGPVRSVRLVDGELMPIFKSVLVTSGGHMAVKLRVTEGKQWAEGYARIICPEEPFLGDGGTMRRIPKEGRRYELTLYSDTTSLWDLVAKRGINERQDFGNMWVFSESASPGATEATHLKIVYKPEQSEVEYEYDQETRTYKRFDLGQPLIDAVTDEQIAPSNVLVLYVNHVDTDIAADTHDPNQTWYSVSIQLWGSGTAKLLRDGVVYEAQWRRDNPQQPTDRLVILDGEGEQIPFHPGPTWIQLVRLDQNVEIN